MNIKPDPLPLPRPALLLQSNDGNTLLYFEADFDQDDNQQAEFLSGVAALAEGIAKTHEDYDIYQEYMPKLVWPEAIAKDRAICAVEGTTFSYDDKYELDQEGVTNYMVGWVQSFID